MTDLVTSRKDPMPQGRTFKVRGRVYCLGSGTAPHPSDTFGHRARCVECGRTYTLRKGGVLSDHPGPTPGSAGAAERAP